MAKRPEICVMGIAGPGDPFANPEETMETLRLVRKKYPENDALRGDERHGHRALH